MVAVVDLWLRSSTPLRLNSSCWFRSHFLTVFFSFTPYLWQVSFIFAFKLLKRCSSDIFFFWIQIFNCSTLFSPKIHGWGRLTSAATANLCLRHNLWPHLYVYQLIYEPLLRLIKYTLQMISTRFQNNTMIFVWLIRLCALLFEQPMYYWNNSWNWSVT